MKAFLRWLAKVMGSVLSIGMIIVLFPFLSKLAMSLLPDESGSAIKTSVILATRLEDSARLETLKVEMDGVLVYDVKAAFLGTVANLNVSYTYEASFGIDLKKVEIRVARNEITFILPQPELIQDSLTPKEVYSDEFWYPGFTKGDYDNVLEKERMACRAMYLNGDQADMLIEKSKTAFEATIATWMRGMNKNLKIYYEVKEAVPVQ